jgi:CHAD domain-containing protein
VPPLEQIDALRTAIERLSYTAEVFANAMPSQQLTALLTACRSALDAYSPLCDAHIATENARRFAAKQRVVSSGNGPQTFAEAQTRVVEARLPDWRGFLQPLL